MFCNSKTRPDHPYVLETLSAQESWRMFRILAEFVEGFETLCQVYPAVTIFGSARVKPDTKVYKDAYKIGKGLAKAGFSIVTGGGPGVMEAANKGCFEAGGLSAGLNIKLPHEQSLNPYTNVHVEFRYFFVRKVMLIRYAVAIVCMPGGFGTLDEFFETITLIQTKKIKPIPIILVNNEYWKGLIDWVSDTLLRNGAIKKEDLSIFHVVDDPEQVIETIRLTAPVERNSY